MRLGVSAAVLAVLAATATAAGAWPVAAAGPDPVVKVALVDADVMPDLRDRLMSALLEAGVRLSTLTDGRDVPAPTLIVSARVQPGGMTASVTGGAGYCVGDTRLGATVDLRVRDAAGGAVAWGAMVAESVSVGSEAVAGRGPGRCGSIAPPMADYRRLTGALALATARRIAFRIAPLRVLATDGRTLTLDRGAPLVPLGALVQVATVAGPRALYRVNASSATIATAGPYGAAAEVAAGAQAELIDGPPPRRMPKVDLP